jgi:hypothetical protein
MSVIVSVDWSGQPHVHYVGDEPQTFIDDYVDRVWARYFDEVLALVLDWVVELHDPIHQHDTTQQIEDCVTGVEFVQFMEGRIPDFKVLAVNGELLDDQS